jgi:hypothetical protein
MDTPRDGSSYERNTQSPKTRQAFDAWFTDFSRRVDELVAETVRQSEAFTGQHRGSV